MTLTVAPEDEACQALVGRINAGTTYPLDVAATYSRVIADPLEEVQQLRVDVVAVTQTQPAETLDNSDNSSHDIKVWVRSQIPSDPTDQASALQTLALLRRLIFIQLNNWQTDDRRVQVWECDDTPDEEDPTKKQLMQAGLYSASIKLRVEVKRDPSEIYS